LLWLLVSELVLLALSSVLTERYRSMRRFERFNELLDCVLEIGWVPLYLHSRSKPYEAQVR